MLLWCRVISTALSGINNACAELAHFTHTSIKAVQHPGEATAPPTYVLIQREVIQHKFMNALYPTKAKESSTLPGTPVDIASQDAVKPTEASVTNTNEVEATKAVGLLKTLDDAGILGLVVIDELHQ